MAYISIGQNGSRGTILPGGYQAISFSVDDIRPVALDNKTNNPLSGFLVYRLIIPSAE
jgi:hypothetical protein